MDRCSYRRVMFRVAPSLKMKKLEAIFWHISSMRGTRKTAKEIWIMSLNWKDTGDQTRATSHHQSVIIS